MLLGVAAPDMASRLEALPAALGVTRPEALALVLEDPLLLLRSPDTLAAAWRELRRAARMRPEWRQQIGGWAASSLNR
jgi:hypothetical protein